MSTGTGDSKSDSMVSVTDAKDAEPESSFESQIFQITAQGGARRFYVHGSILSKCSQPFRSVVEGGWKESAEHIINLNDWDGDTVERLLQFLHTGAYQWPIPKKRVAEELRPSEGGSGIFIFRSPTPKAKTEFEIDRPLTPISQLFEAEEIPVVLLDYNAWLSTTKLADHDLGDLLLSHAKVYALANYKDIANLKRLALDRTLKTLTALGTLEDRSREVIYIIELLKYVYENTNSLFSGPEPMRKLVVRFTALNLTTLNSDNKVSILMGSSAELAQDLMSDVTRRVQALEIGSSVRTKMYISGLEVRIGGEEPGNCVQEYNWGDPNLNSGTLLLPVWLVPRFTDVGEQACTSFRKGIVHPLGHLYDKGDVIPFPKGKGILLPCRDGGPLRIRHLQFLRTSASSATVIMGQQQLGKCGVLECINYQSPPTPTPSLQYTFLHLMWKY